MFLNSTVIGTVELKIPNLEVQEPKYHLMFCGINSCKLYCFLYLQFSGGEVMQNIHQTSTSLTSGNVVIKEGVNNLYIVGNVL